MTIAVENDVPLPAAEMGRPKLYPFEKMAIGDSFAVPAHVKRENFARQACLAGTRLRVKFTVRKTPDGLRCWRTA